MSKFAAPTKSLDGCGYPGVGDGRCERREKGEEGFPEEWRRQCTHIIPDVVYLFRQFERV